MNHRRGGTGGHAALALVALGLVVLVPVRADPRTTFRQENTPANLQALLQRFHRLTHADQKPAEAAALFQALIPDEPRLKKALRDDVAPETVRTILGMYERLGPLTGENVGRLTRPDQTVVRVHGATTEEILRYAEGSVAFNEFPGGTRRVAELVLRPGMTYYEAEFLKPGEDLGIKYHLFFWDGAQWSMLGPIWRVME